MRLHSWTSGVLSVTISFFGACRGESVEESDTETDVDAPAEQDCADGTDNDADGALDCDDPDCASQALCEFEPMTYTIRGNFAYDAAGDRVIAATLAGEVYPPRIQVYLTDPDYRGQEYTCALTLTYTGALPVAATRWETSGGGVYVGVWFKDGTYELDNECQAPGFAARAEAMAAVGWGVGLAEKLGDFNFRSFLDTVGGNSSVSVSAGVQAGSAGFSQNGSAEAFRINAAGNLLNDRGEVATAQDAELRRFDDLTAAEVVTSSGTLAQATFQLRTHGGLPLPETGN